MHEKQREGEKISVYLGSLHTYESWAGTGGGDVPTLWRTKEARRLCSKAMMMVSRRLYPACVVRISIIIIIGGFRGFGDKIRSIGMKCHSLEVSTTGACELAI